ncbi:leucine-rich repeat extensin-like protein 5 [Pollicipes pollicipes]|uniref:leucine-rich repeat extensin-like protein 5 n=1 Tax=Pollicipes pollicipes TaxID=41117 RepID=UPI0018856704|nr:leucine-rich repeat extensin-like protein 5 [Pollicipes pollicipes]
MPMKELSVGVPAAGAPLLGPASACGQPPPAHGWTHLLHATQGFTYSGHLSPLMTSSISPERSTNRLNGRSKACRRSAEPTTSPPASPHAPPPAGGGQSAPESAGAGRSLPADATAAAAAPAAAVQAEKAGGAAQGGAESDTETRRDLVQLAPADRRPWTEAAIACRARNFPGGEVRSLARDDALKRARPTPLFRPYSDNLVRARGPVSGDERERERANENSVALCLRVRPDSPPPTAEEGRSAAGEGARPPIRADSVCSDRLSEERSTGGDISGDVSEPAGYSDICGATVEPAGCCRTRPLNQTWGRCQEWYRRRRRRPCPSSDVTQPADRDVTPERMISISGLSPFAAAPAGGEPAPAEPGRPGAAQAGSRAVLPATAPSGKLVGIAKARQREPEPCTSQATVLTSIAGRLNLPGFTAPSVWAGAGRDMGVAGWSMGGPTAPGPAHLPPPPSVWLGQTTPYAATPLFTGYPQSYQLHSDPTTGHWMLVPRTVAEPAPRPAVLWSPYQCMPPLQSQQLTVLPSQPPQLYIQQSPTEQAPLLTSTGNHSLKKEDPTSRLKPIQPAPAHVPASPSSAPPLPVQYIIPAAPLQSVYYTHAEPPAPFILQPAPAPPQPSPQQLAPSLHAAVPSAPGVHTMATVGQLPILPHVPLVAPEPPPAPL